MKNSFRLFLFTFLSCLLLGVSVYAQQDNSEPRVLKHSLNPHVKKVEALASEYKFDEIEKIYKNLKAIPQADTLDLMVLAASRFKDRDIISWKWVSDENTMKMLQDYVSVEGSSDEEKYRKGIINYVMGNLLSSKNVTISAYLTLSSLASKGWTQTFAPVADILYTIYINQYRPTELKEIVPTIASTMGEPASAENIIKLMSEGLSGSYSMLSDAEMKVQGRRLEFTKYLLDKLVSDNDEYLLYVVHSLWTRSTTEPGLTDKIQYREDYTKNYESIVNGLISTYPNESKPLQKFQLVTKMIYDSGNSSSVAQKYISLEPSREDAYKFIIDIFDTIPIDASFELFADSDKSWAKLFEN